MKMERKTDMIMPSVLESLGLMAIFAWVACFYSSITGKSPEGVSLGYAAVHMAMIAMVGIWVIEPRSCPSLNKGILMLAEWVRGRMS